VRDPSLQMAEQKGELDTPKCFIFDLDHTPTALGSTKLVKVLQWKRRCLENYLIDEKIIYDVLKDSDVAKKAIGARGEVPEVFKRIALAQIQRQVVERIYDSYMYENPGLRPKEVTNRAYIDASSVLFSRLAKIQAQVGSLNQKEWCDTFVSKCEEQEKKERATWEAEWLVLCDGKRFLRDIHMEFGVKFSVQRFKKLIVERMERDQSESWVLVEKLLSDAVRV
jgi:hypothetical protein